MMSAHAQLRCQARGVRDAFVGAILTHADVDHPIGDNCRIIRVSRQRAQRLNIDDRLGRYAVIWSDDTSRIVTILPIHDSSSAARYRRTT